MEGGRRRLLTDIFKYIGYQIYDQRCQEEDAGTDGGPVTGRRPASATPQGGRRPLPAGWVWVSGEGAAGLAAQAVWAGWSTTR